MTFSSYFNVLWQEPRLHISERFLQELNSTSPETMIPVNLELVNELWLPNIFIYNLKTFKVRGGYFKEQKSGVILTSTEPNIFRILFSIKNQNPSSTRNIDMAGYY